MKIFKRVLQLLFYGGILGIIVLNLTGKISFNVVVGTSMEPNYSETDYLIAVALNGNIEELNRGNVVIAKAPGGKEVIKRVIALPGDFIEIKNGTIYVNKEEIQEGYVEDFRKDNKTNLSLRKLGADEVFICGDNRNNSHDSRSYGPIKVEQVDGRVLVKIPISIITKLIQKG